MIQTPGTGTLSNAPLPLPNIGVAPASPSTTPPGYQSNFYSYYSEFLQQAQADAGGVIAFPLDSPKYQMCFSFGEYVRTNLTTVGQFQTAQGYAGIILPFPEQMVDVDHTNWAEESLGFATGSAINAATASGGTVGARAGAGAALGAVAAGGFISGAVPGVGQAISAAEALANPVLSQFGVAPNEFLTLLFRGPTYKRHKFSWNLAPNNFQEADNIRLITKTFRNASAPGIFASLLNSPVLWQYPKIVYIRLYPNSKFMYKFKPCIIDTVAVNYTVGNKFSPLRNPNPGANDGNNPPAMVQMQIEFIELEFWTEGNYGDSNDPTDVYGISGTTNAGGTTIGQIASTFGTKTGITDIAKQVGAALGPIVPGVTPGTVPDATGGVAP